MSTRVAILLCVLVTATVAHDHYIYVNGAVLQRRTTKDYYEDWSGTLSGEDVFYSVVRFRNFSTPRAWSFPSAATINTFIPDNTTDMYWAFDIVNYSGSTLALTGGGGGVVMWGSLRPNGIGVIPDAHMAHIIMHNENPTTYNAYIYISFQ